MHHRSEEERPTATPLSSAKRAVLLPRMHWFEFFDQSWLPPVVRSMISLAIGRGFVLFHAGELMGEVLTSLVRESGSQSILELAAGSAMPSVALSNELHQRGQAVAYCVSDKYPELEAFRRASEASEGRVQFIDQPVDVLDIPCNLQGLRLLVTSFHHFRPELAARILREAYERRLPIAIFEVTDRRLVRTLSIGPLGFLYMLGLLPASIKAHSWRAVLWVLPAAVAFAWDGFVSCLRSYTVNELESMTLSLSDGYRWRMGDVATPVPGVRITYLTGSA